MDDNVEITRKLDTIISMLRSETPVEKINTLKFDVNMYIKCLIHELRTPITTVSLGLNALEDQIITESEALTVDNSRSCNCKDFLDIIHDLYSTIRYIDDTLNKFCVIQDGNLVLNAFKPVSIREMMECVENILQYNLKEKQIKFEYLVDDCVYDYVYGDKYNIKHCLINLLKNSIKYSQSNCENRITISVTNTLDENTNGEQTIIFSVIDNNKAIPKNIKEKLFEPFNSTSGSGLGLYICKKIVELHGGVISHDYLENIGNQFNITIKFKNCIVMGTASSSSILPEIKMGEPEHTKYNIMIVDDSAINVNLIRKSFSNNAMIDKIHTAVDGLDAIHQICNNMDAIDVLFIDNQMPNLSGTQTVKLLRGGMQFDKLIFGITGSNNNELSEFKNCGIDYVFSKPFDRSKLNIVFSFLSKHDIKRYPDKKLQIVNEQLVWV
jgi:CheY-like chemotaxis protein